MFYKVACYESQQQYFLYVNEQYFIDFEKGCENVVEAKKIMKTNKLWLVLW